jgi:hypothetical protein
MTTADMYDKIWDQVEDEIQWRFWDYLHELVIGRVDGRVNDQIWNSTWDLVRSQVAAHCVVQVRGSGLYSIYPDDFGPIIEQVQSQIKESG